ncbi:MAG: FGGY-family carbohydrate kinase [Deltaproteobacteria bacterium]
MQKKYVIGVDGGTESLRAGIFDLSGNPLAFASVSYPTNFPIPGWAEQNPEDWWNALGGAVRQAVIDANVGKQEILGICLDTTCCSVVALDGAGNPLRPALIWMDMRSAPQTEQVLATADPALQVNSNGSGPVSAEWMIPKSLWIRQEEPEIFEKAETVCEFQDYLNLHLTGKRVASINNVSVRWHYGPGWGGWARSMVESLEMSELLKKWPDTVLRLGEEIGGLTSNAAAHLDLPEGVPVLQGGADAFIGMIGLGVVNPGSLAFITGSSHLHLGLSPQAFHGQGIWGTYAEAVIPGLHVVEGGQTSTGSVVSWIRRTLGSPSYEELNHEAAQLEPGSEGVVIQEHFQGNRTPHTDPLSRGVISGLTLKHGRGHLFRAALEGIAFGTELILETMRNNGFAAETVVLAGGATRSDLWLQIHADVSNLPLTLTKVPDAPALGSAILAAVGSGAFSDIGSAVRKMVQIDRVIEPNSETHALYQPFYQSYRNHYLAMKNVRAGL